MGVLGCSRRQRRRRNIRRGFYRKGARALFERLAARRREDKRLLWPRTRGPARVCQGWPIDDDEGPPGIIPDLQAGSTGTKWSFSETFASRTFRKQAIEGGLDASAASRTGFGSTADPDPEADPDVDMGGIGLYRMDSRSELGRIVDWRAAGVVEGAPVHPSEPLSPQGCIPHLGPPCLCGS
jgi:hypothetical protein